MSSRSLGSELPEPAEAGPGGDAADAGATRGAQRARRGGHASCCGTELQRSSSASLSACVASCSQLAPTDALRLRRSPGLLRRIHAPGALRDAHCATLNRRAQRSALDMPRTLTFAPRGARRLQTSPLWASTSSRSTCASQSRLSSPPRCRPRAAGAHTRAAPSPHRSARHLSVARRAASATPPRRRRCASAHIPPPRWLAPQKRRKASCFMSPCAQARRGRRAGHHEARARRGQPRAAQVRAEVAFLLPAAR